MNTSPINHSPCIAVDQSPPLTEEKLYERKLKESEVAEIQSLLASPFPPFNDLSTFLFVLVHELTHQIDRVEIKGSTVFKLLEKSGELTDYDLVIYPKGEETNEFYDRLQRNCLKAIGQIDGCRFSSLCISTGEKKNPRYLLRIGHPNHNKIDLQVCPKLNQAYTCTFDEPSIDITSMILPNRTPKLLLRSRKFPLEECLRDWREKRFRPFIPTGTPQDKALLKEYFESSQGAFFRFSRLIGVKECLIGMEGLCEGFWAKWLEENPTNREGAWKKDVEEALNEVGEEPSRRMELLLFLLFNFPLQNHMIDTLRECWPKGEGALSRFVGDAADRKEFLVRANLLALRCSARLHFKEAVDGPRISLLSTEHKIARYCVEWGNERIVLNLPQKEATVYLEGLFDSIHAPSHYQRALKDIRWKGSPLQRENFPAEESSVMALLASRFSLPDSLLQKIVELEGSEGVIGWLLATDGEMGDVFDRIMRQWANRKPEELFNWLKKISTSATANQVFTHRVIYSMIAALLAHYFNKSPLQVSEIDTLKLLHTMGTEVQKEQITHFVKEQLKEAISKLPPSALEEWIDRGRELISQGTIDENLLLIAFNRLLTATDSALQEELIKALTVLPVAPFNSKAKNPSAFKRKLGLYLFKNSSLRSWKTYSPEMIHWIFSNSELSEELRGVFQQALSKDDFQTLNLLLPFALKSDRPLNITPPEYLEKILSKKQCEEPLCAALTERLQEKKFAEDLLKSSCKGKHLLLLSLLLKDHAYPLELLIKMRSETKSKEVGDAITKTLDTPRLSIAQFQAAIEQNPAEAYRLWKTYVAQLRSDPHYLLHLPNFIHALRCKNLKAEFEKVLDGEFNYYTSQNKRIEILKNIFSLNTPQPDELKIWADFYHKQIANESQPEVITFFIPHFSWLPTDQFMKILKQGNYCIVNSSHSRKTEILIAYIDRLLADIAVKAEKIPPDPDHLILMLQLFGMKKEHQPLNEGEIDRVMSLILSLDAMPDIFEKISTRLVIPFLNDLLSELDSKPIQSYPLQFLLFETHARQIKSENDLQKLTTYCLEDIFYNSLDPDRLCNDREYVKLLSSLFVENGALIPELKRHLSSNVLSSDRETFINAMLKLMPLAISGEICDPKEICWFCEHVFELLQPSSCPNKAIAENPIPMEEQIDLLQILIVSIQNNTSSPASPFDYREQILTVLNFTLERLAAMTDVRDPLVSRLYETLMTCLTSGKEDRDLAERAAVKLTAVINDSPDFFLVTRTLQLFGKLSVANAELRKALSNRLITTIGEVTSVNTLYSLLRTICDQNALIFSMGKEMTLQLIHLIYKHWDEIISQPQGLSACTELLKMRSENPTLLEMDSSNWIRFGTDVGRNILEKRVNRFLFEDCYTALEKLYLDHREVIDSRWEGLIDLLFDLHLQISKKNLQRMKTLSDLLKRKDLSSIFSSERSRLMWCTTFVVPSQRYSGEDVIDMVAFPLQILKQASSSKRVTEADKHIFSLFFTCLSHTGAPSIALIDGVRSKLNACGRFLAQTDPSLMISLQVLLRDFMEILIFKREKNNDTAIYNLWVQIIKSFPQNSLVFIRQAENILLDLANQMQPKSFCSEAKRTFASSLIQNPEIASKCIHKIVLFWNVLLDEKTRNRLIDEISTAQPSLAHYFKAALESTVCEINLPLNTIDPMQVEAAFLQRSSSPLADLIALNQLLHTESPISPTGIHNWSILLNIALGLILKTFKSEELTPMERMIRRLTVMNVISRLFEEGTSIELFTRAAKENAKSIDEIIALITKEPHHHNLPKMTSEGVSIYKRYLTVLKKHVQPLIEQG